MNVTKYDRRNGEKPGFANFTGSPSIPVPYNDDKQRKKRSGQSCSKKPRPKLQRTSTVATVKKNALTKGNIVSFGLSAFFVVSSFQSKTLSSRTTFSDGDASFLPCSTVFELDEESRDRDRACMAAGLVKTQERSLRRRNTGIGMYTNDKLQVITYI
jgi:hypothetical protein